MTIDSRIAVVGLGYVGLPLAISFVEAGLTSRASTPRRPRVAELNAGSFADRRHLGRAPRARPSPAG